MFTHYSLRGVRAAVAAVRALAAKAGRVIRPMALPDTLKGKRRQGMSAKSPYGRYRNRCATIHAHVWPKRLARATGPGSYAEASPQDLIRAERAKCDDNGIVNA